MEEDRSTFYRVDRYQENIVKIPDRAIDPPGNLGWLIRHYRARGWNISTLRSDAFEAFGSLYGLYGPDGIFDLYKALLFKREYHEQLNAANDDEPDCRREAARLWGALEEPEERQGWFASWRPPTYGPEKPSPFALITSRLPRVHTRLYRSNMLALLTTGNPSPFV